MEGTKADRGELHLPFSTLPLWNISAPAATFLATCVASEVSAGALLTGVAAAVAAYQNEEVVSPIETARKRMIIIVAVAAFLLFWPVSFPERFFFAN